MLVESYIICYNIACVWYGWVCKRGVVLHWVICFWLRCSTSIMKNIICIMIVYHWLVAVCDINCFADSGQWIETRLVNRSDSMFVSIFIIIVTMFNRPLTMSFNVLHVRLALTDVMTAIVINETTFLQVNVKNVWSTKRTIKNCRSADKFSWLVAEAKHVSVRSWNIKTQTHLLQIIRAFDRCQQNYGWIPMGVRAHTTHPKHTKHTKHKKNK